MLTIKNFANDCVERTKRDKDVAVAITGIEGDGKTALSLGVGIDADPFFDLERNVLFTPSVTEIKEKIYSLPPHSPVIADEAIKIMYKLNWTSKKQKRLNQIYTVCRNQNKISIFNIPRLTDTNEYFRNHRLRWWIHIVDPISNEKKEGHAVVMSRSWNPVTTDPWGLKIFEKRMEDYRKKLKDTEYELEDKIDLFSNLPTFVDVLKFNWVKESIWKEYLRIKNQTEYDDEELFDEDIMQKKIDEWRFRTLKSIKTFLHLGYSKSAVCKLYDIHPNTLSGWLKEEHREQDTKEFNRPEN